jgi:D-beta-D-heptose 7-phosphate kinase/D-beta-D-heptose 1-phosphate adenosyltransferase
MLSEFVKADCEQRPEQRDTRRNEEASVIESLIRNTKRVPVLVAGDVMVDEYIMGSVERISPEAPVPVLVVKDRLRRLGGAGNVVKNLVVMGAGVALLAAVGKDSSGRWFREHCEELGIEGFWLKESSARPTTLKTRVVARNQQIVRIDEEHVAGISPELESSVIEDIKSVVPQVKAAVVSDYGKGFLTRPILECLIAEARAAKIPVLVDPKGLDFSRYRGATYITPNVREASVAAGVEIRDPASLVRAARVLIDQTGAEAIAVTRGRDGITLVTRRDSRDFSVKPVEIIDVTGAGDTVIAALALGVANGFSIEDSVVMANIAASLVVARFGAASVTLQEMLDSLKDHAPHSKVIRRGEIAAALRPHRMQGKKIAFTNGCFDLLHVGHLETLRQAAKQANVLVVGINSDASVKRIKGPGRPVMPEAERVELVSALDFVHYVVVFDEDTPQLLIEETRPDVLVKGEDWAGKKVVGEEVVRSKGGEVRFVKLVRGISTTDLINRIRNGS